MTPSSKCELNTADLNILVTRNKNKNAMCTKERLSGIYRQNMDYTDIINLKNINMNYDL